MSAVDDLDLIFDLEKDLFKCSRILIYLDSFFIETSLKLFQFLLPEQKVFVHFCESCFYLLDIYNRLG